MDVWALGVAVFGVIVIIRMIITGSAAANGEGLRRDEQPEIYWAVFVAAVLLVGFLFGRGLGSW